MRKVVPCHFNVYFHISKGIGVSGGKKEAKNLPGRGSCRHKEVGGNSTGFNIAQVMGLKRPGEWATQVSTCKLESEPVRAIVLSPRWGRPPSGS